ncbi:response regulator [Sphingomonas sp. KRR8]|uniref:response regulator n=1 Tax=Sphingomonas sp. KRR8 TaxID=2942996 RepID=UPI0020205223|nr:response regulator [Sphingomonas sp. KRR8]URD61721.1 response regulator [Sphingomonas sp. KRR8]
MERPRLLLIDDEPALAAFVASAAHETGYQAAIGTNETDFQRQFHEERPDAVALDLGMPGMDGVELLRFLSAESFSGPVLIISGFDRRVLDSAFRLGEALGLNMVGPLEKPTRLHELEEILKEVRPAPAR